MFLSFCFNTCKWSCYLALKSSLICVTGMLLELPGPVLIQMLQDDAMLTAAVEKALRALQVAQEPRYRNGQ